jgi:3-dehydroquinate synthase
VLTTLEKIGFQLWSEAFDQRGEGGELSILRGLREFREHLGGELSVTLLKEIGRGFEAHEIDEARMREALDRLRNRHRARDD